MGAFPGGAVQTRKTACAKAQRWDQADKLQEHQKAGAAGVAREQVVGQGSER